MPVRRIPKNHLTVTGAFASRKNGRMVSFESLLERDHMLLLEFDANVARYEEQPVVVPLDEAGSRARKYVPDILVHYEESTQRRPLLAEVKHTSDLARNAEKYAPKFDAALRFAEARGWDFATVTEQSIRGPFLQNLKFLREYRNVQPSDEHIDQVLTVLGEAGGAEEVAGLLDRLASSKDEQLHWVPTIWHLVVTGRLGTELQEPLTDRSLLALPTESAA